MNASELPFWLRLALRLPLSWKHRLRDWAHMAEYWSTKLVLLDSSEILMLIENREFPDFEEFDRRLHVARLAWGRYDPFIEGLAVRRRLLAFKLEHKIK